MSGYTRLTEGFGQAASQLRGQFGNFANNQYVSGTKEFLESNSLIAKVSFLLLIVISFVLLLRLGVSLISWAMSPSNTPKLIDGMKDAKKPQVVKQNPNVKGSKPITRSVNQQDGIEFTYSVWLYIDDLEYGKGKYKHIFHKGNDNFATTGNHNGMNQPNNAPGLYLDKESNRLVIVMNTFDNINEQVTVNDIPLNKWINVILRVEGNKMDVYINGTIVLRHIFNGVPKQNYGDVYVNLDGGFSGLLSDLFYFNNGLTTSEILDLVKDGPNMKMDTSMDIFPPYFSMRWYMNN
jgi:hypothetical protein